MPSHGIFRLVPDLDRLVNHVRSEVHEALFAQITANLSTDEIAQLEALLKVPEAAYMSGFTRLKQSPGPATLHQMRAWVAHLTWLESLDHSQTELTLDESEKPHLKHLEAQPLPKGLEAFKEKLQAQMPIRHLLDILRDAHAWVPYTRHFDTASGAASSKKPFRVTC